MGMEEWLPFPTRERTLDSKRLWLFRLRETSQKILYYTYNKQTRTLSMWQRNPLRTIGTDFFSVIFGFHPDLKYHPKDGVEGLRKAPRPKFMPFFSFFLSLFCLKVGPQILCSPTLRGQLLSSVLFSSVIPHGMKVVFVFPLPLTLRSGLKPRVVSVLLLLGVLVCSSVLGFLHPCAQG